LELKNCIKLKVDLCKSVKTCVKKKAGTKKIQ